MAHRGFSLDGLENTMTAFAAAVSLGMTHVETDVHATRDGVVVAFHDAVLDRVSDGHGAIAELTWDELRSVRVGGSEVVPRLEELLDSWPDLRVNVDVKDWAAIAGLVDVVQRTAAQHRVCVTSFDDRRTAAVRRLLGPQVATSPGRRGVARWRFASWLPGPGAVRLSRVRDRSAVAFQVPATAGPLRVVTRRSLDVAHQLGLQVHVWTVNDASRMHELLDLGVDGLITDRSDTLREVLRERAAGRA
ncbi:glycerophosphodiester phosphodiesterase [Angustibacter sp. McL0619]|uniref:glycerophosphodiester phosphodiesterase n=1 Tax=Angustibacter sp. McL0619 TaxID=3415676 RepID=UPI003CF21F9D